MKQIALSAIAMMLVLPAMARTEYTVQPVTDIPTSGRVWDLTQCEQTGGEHEYRVDSGAEKSRVWSPVKRFDFYTTPGDTVWQTCAETRAFRTLFVPGILRQLPGDASGSGLFTFKGRIYQADFVIGEGGASVDNPVKGVLMSWQADTIGGAMMYHDVSTFRWFVTADSLMRFENVPDSLVCTTTVDSYRVMAPYEQFPRAFKRVNTVAVNGQIVERDSSAWVLSYTPSAVTERSRRLSMPGGKEPYGSLMPGSHGGNVYVSIKAASNNIIVVSEREVGAGVMITDVLGRMYYEQAVSLSPAGTSIGIDMLPRGEYLIQIIPDDGSKPEVVKFVK